MFPLNVVAAAQAVVVTITDTVIVDLVSGPIDARAALVIGADGIMYQELGIVPVRTAINQPSDWIDPKIGAALYEVMVTVAGDPLHPPSDAEGVWLPLSSERIWIQIETQNNNSESSTLTVQVRIGTTVKDTGTITLVADTTLP